MAGTMHADITLFNGTEVNYRLLFITFLISMVLHVLFFGVFLFIPSQPPKKYMLPPAITVSMVSLSAEEETVNTEEPLEAEEEHAPLVNEENLDIKAANPEEPPVLADNPEIPEMQPEAPPEAVPPPEQPEPQPENIPEPKELVVIKDIPEEKKLPVPEKKAAKVEKTSPQKEKPPAQPVKIIKADPRTKKPEKIKEKIIRPEDVGKISIKQAIDRIRQKAARETAKTSSASSSRVSGGRTSSGPVNDVYRAQITYHIEQNWAFSEQLLKKRSDLETHVAVSVLPDGSIQNVWFQRKSGDSYLDDSAYRAVMKSNPFPPLPQGYSEAHTFVLRFTPSGLN